jgi:hypothetical protein
MSRLVSSSLPNSFLNRYAKVYVDKMTHHDLLHISRNIYTQIASVAKKRADRFDCSSAQISGAERERLVSGSPEFSAVHERGFREQPIGERIQAARE